MEVTLHKISPNSPSRKHILPSISIHRLKSEIYCKKLEILRLEGKPL